MAIRYVSCGPLALPETKPAGVVFDMDGTLVDTMPLHFQAWQAALMKVDASHAFPEDLFYRYGGRSAVDILDEFKENYGFAYDSLSVAEDKRREYTKRVFGSILLIEESLDYLHQMRAAGVPCAIGTGSTLSIAEKTLKAAGIYDCFECIITPELVEKGKPAPDIFLLAAERMGVPPASCVVLEDAVPGIEAAAAAGMHCIQVPLTRREFPPGSVEL